MSGELLWCKVHEYIHQPTMMIASAMGSFLATMKISGEGDEMDGKKRWIDFEP